MFGCFAKAFAFVRHLAAPIGLAALAACSGGGGTPVGIPTDLKYSEPSPVYIRGRVITPNTPSNSGGAITSYAVSPELPAGLSLNASTGTITGTPTVTAAAATYVVTGSNDSGSANAPIYLNVVDVPVLSYANATGTTVTFGEQMVVTPTTLKTNGSLLADCTLAPGSPALPSGLSLDAMTCVISGTSTLAFAPIQLSVVAINNWGASDPAPVTLSVNSAVPTLDYTGATGTTGSFGMPMTVTPTTLKANGAVVTGCAVSGVPALPAGLSVNATTCVISGTPTAPMSPTEFSIVATNAAGNSMPAKVSLRVDPVAPTLSFANATGTTGPVGVSMTVTPTTLAANGATIVTCTAQPPLPPGLVLNDTTCVISGTPTQATPKASYAITATNSAGDSTAMVSLTVTDVPTLSYAGTLSTTGVFGTAMSIAPTVLLEHDSPLTDCRVKASTPALPPGLSVNPMTCVISGTPSVAISATTFTIVATNAVGTSSDAQVTLTINAAVPSLSYLGATGTTGTFGSAMTVTPTTLSPRGSAVNNCIIFPSLPAGLSLNNTTCVISGTPTAASPATNYVVNARNAIGYSADAFLTLAVNPAPPVLSYAGTSGTTLTAGSAANIAPTTLTLNGGALISCAVKTGTPALPAGLVIDDATCVISGTPSAPAAAATYTLVATNAGGASADATLSLAVQAGVPTLSYEGAANTAGVVGTAMTVNPTTLLGNGANVTACAITGAPAKPAWLSVNASTCVLSGTPPATLASTTFNVVASNTSGASTAAPVTLSVNAAPAVPTLSYAGAGGTTMRLGVAAQVAPTTLEANGSTLIGCSVTAGTLPAGLSINPGTCVISGTPTGLSAAANYSVMATNGVGSSTAAVVNLVVADVPSLSFMGASGTSVALGTALSVSPTTLSANHSPITACAIKPGTTALPATLSVNPATCAITGTPNATLATTPFTLVATNAIGDSADATVSLAVNAAVPTVSFAGATGSPGTFGALMTVSPTTLSSNGASITGCSVMPALPAGLSINTTTCVISGTPTSIAASASYAVTATNSAGNSSPASVTLAVNPAVPTLSYAGATGTTGSYGMPMSITPTTLAGNGGSITGCSVSPALPAGLSINTTTCVVSGTPSAAVAATTYSITALNAAGPSAAAPLTLTISALPPSLSYAASTGTAGRAGAAMSVIPSMFSANGAPVTACVVMPTLPAGLSLSATTCTISGTPTAVSASANYTVIATNSAGDSAAANVTLSIGANVPTLSYAASTGTTGTFGSPMTVTPSSFSNNGAAITGCSASPALPAGLSVDSMTCVISGIPSAVAPTASYTITASNSEGSSTGAAVSLTVNAAIPVLSYAGASGTTGTFGSPMSISPTTLNANGASVTGCAVHAGTTALPAGLSVSPTTCVISGTPSATVSGGSYALVATNSAGNSADAPLTLTINAAVPTLSYASGNTVGSVGKVFTLTPSTLAANGAAITNCTVTPALPGGLSLSLTTCAISGTPSTVTAQATYTVKATNSAGTSADAPVSLSIIDVPGLSYAGASGTIGTTGAMMTVSPTTLTNNGSTLSNCVATPSLPSGLTLNTSTCVISGTPNTAQAQTSYSITASNAAGDSVAASVSLTVRAPASLTLSDGPTYAFGAWSTTSTTSHIFGVLNSGEVPATSLASGGAIGTGFAFKGGSYPGVGGTCGATLAAGASCIVVVSFAPTSAIPYTGTVSLSYQDGVQARTATRPVTGSGTASAALVITDFPPHYYTDYGLPADGATFNFGTLGSGVPVDHTFSVTNNGGASATLTSGSALTGAFTYKGGTFPGAGGTCGLSTLGAGQTCTVVVTLTASAGPNSNSFTVNYTGGSSPSVSRSMTGTGTANAVLTLYDFGNGDNGGTGINIGPSWDYGTSGVGTNNDHDFLLLNSGGSAAGSLAAGPMPTGFSFPGGFPGGTPGASANIGNGVNFCTNTLAAGTGCAVRVRFTPAAAQLYSGNITVNFGVSSSATRPVRGVGTTYGLLSIMEDGNRGGVTFDFETRAVGSSTPQTFIVTNVGAASATGLAQVALGTGFGYVGGSFPGGTGNYTDNQGNSTPYCAQGGSLSVGARCAIKVHFTPGSATSFSGNLQLNYADGSGTPQSASRAMQGVGTNAAVVTLDCDGCDSGGGNSTLNFGTVGASTTTARLLLVRNNGAQSTSLSLGSLQGSTFAWGGSGFPGGTGQSNFQGSNYPFCGPSPYSLGAGQACVLLLTYSAPASDGVQSGLLTLNTTNALTANVTLPLVASSTTKAIVSLRTCTSCGNYGGGTPNYDYGYTATGTTKTQYFFLTNSGASGATVSAGTLSGSAFAYTSSSYPGGTPSSAIFFNGQPAYYYCPTSGGVLGAGQTCVISVSYTASGSLQQTGSLSVNLGNATATSVNHTLSGTPTNLAIMSLSDCYSCGTGGGGGGGPGQGNPTHDFGSVAANQTYTAYFIVRNTGNTAGTVTNGGITGAAFGFGSGYPGGTAGSAVNIDGQSYNFCPASGGMLAGGQSCVLKVSYAATGSTMQTGSLSLSFGGATTTSSTWNLSGSPTTAAIMSLSPCFGCGSGGNGQGFPTYDFGTVASGQTASTYFFLQNMGVNGGTVTNGGISGTGFSFGTGYPGGTAGSTVNINGQSFNFCPASGGTLAGGQTCVLKVFYAATGTATQQGTFQLNFGSATTPNAGYNLSGSPTTLAIMNLSTCDGCGGPQGSGPFDYDFGTVATGGTYNMFFFLVNNGSSAATVSNGLITGSSAFTYAGSGYPGGTAGSTVNIWGQNYNYCPTSGGSLAAGGKCVIQIKYSPTGTMPQTATWTLNFTGATTSNIVYNLHGQPTTLAIVSLGECAGCGQSFNPFDYGAAGTALDKIFVVSNGGSSAAGLTDAATLAAPFSYTTGSYPGGTGSVTVNGQTMNFCGMSLAANSMCALSVRFSGTATGNGTVTLNLTSATTANVSRQLMGASTTRALLTVDTDNSFVPCSDTTCGPVPFTGVTVGSQQSWNFFVTNRGGQNATVLGAGNAFATGFGYGPLAASAFPGGTGSISINGTMYSYCGATLAKGAQCVLLVTFKPAMSGTVNSGVNLSYSDAMGALPNANRNVMGQAP